MLELTHINKKYITQMSNNECFQYNLPTNKTSYLNCYNRNAVFESYYSLQIQFSLHLNQGQLNAA